MALLITEKSKLELKKPGWCRPTWELDLENPKLPIDIYAVARDKSKLELEFPYARKIRLGRAYIDDPAYDGVLLIRTELCIEHQKYAHIVGVTELDGMNHVFIADEKTEIGIVELENLIKEQLYKKQA